MFTCSYAREGPTLVAARGWDSAGRLDPPAAHAPGLGDGSMHARGLDGAWRRGWPDGAWLRLRGVAASHGIATAHSSGDSGGGIAGGGDGGGAPESARHRRRRRGGGGRRAARAPPPVAARAAAGGGRARGGGGRRTAGVREG
ncbi:hypothetical protein PVAP13_9KG413250 [Panicum virgatum]|uniref:Uncharacterized protein n=1 Tax=Panicum virgatum TaxID=38727 RepID=A0A8T0NX15_PANVG|nr:hypothetical protein PVAP13_9KG413250 [Panicum virgatum]